MRVLTICFLAGAIAAAPAAASDLASHKAVYKIRLARAAPAGTVQGMSGEMELTVQELCDGLMVNQVLKTDFWEQDGIVHAGELTASSWEPKDGLSLRFTIANRIDGETAEAFEGEAKRPKAGASGSIVYAEETFPEAKLPASAMFPRAHLDALIAAAQAGKRVLEADVFDGASEGTTYATTAILGPKLVQDTVEPGAGPLKGMDHWPVVLSYFPTGTDSPFPNYETSFHLYANGISGNLVMDYGDFALKGTLDALEILETPACE